MPPLPTNPEFASSSHKYKTSSYYQWQDGCETYCEANANSKVNLADVVETKEEKRSSFYSKFWWCICTRIRGHSIYSRSYRCYRMFRYGECSWVEDENVEG